MEQSLLKLARQLNKYDEASLMELWQNYASRVARFEPSGRWEEAALALCMIQSLHWKNQLYNAELAAGARRGKAEDKKFSLWVADLTPNPLETVEQPMPEQTAGAKEFFHKTDDPGEGTDLSVPSPSGSCRILLFTPAEQME